jgi:RND family efflux transporter MFP subunit
MRRNLVIFLALITALGAAAWWRYGSSIEVSVALAQHGTAAEIVYGTGTVEPVRWAKVTTVVRDRIIDLCRCEGETVSKGDILARLDDREAQAQLKELRAREEFLKREMSRVSELMARGTTTTQAFERASRDVNQIQALIALQEVKINDYIIRSPMDGVVLRRDGEIGEIVEVGQVLFRIGVPKPLWVVAEVNEEDIPRVAVGQAALLRTDAFPNEKLQARVRDITPMGDPVTKTYRIRLDLPNEMPVLPGMSVEVNVITRQKAHALLVPTNSVLDNSVFLIQGSTVRRRAVGVGIRGTQRTEIRSGLKEGDLVASPASGELKDGSRVRVLTSTPNL